MSEKKTTDESKKENISFFRRLFNAIKFVITWPFKKIADLFNYITGRNQKSEVAVRESEASKTTSTNVSIGTTPTGKSLGNGISTVTTAAPTTINTSPKTVSETHIPLFGSPTPVTQADLQEETPAPTTQADLKKALERALTGIPVTPPPGTSTDSTKTVEKLILVNPNAPTPPPPPPPPPVGLSTSGKPSTVQTVAPVSGKPAASTATVPARSPAGNLSSLGTSSAVSTETSTTTPVSGKPAASTEGRAGLFAAINKGSETGFKLRTKSDQTPLRSTPLAPKSTPLKPTSSSTPTPLTTPVRSFGDDLKTALEKRRVAVEGNGI